MAETAKNGTDAQMASHLLAMRGKVAALLVRRTLAQDLEAPTTAIRLLLAGRGWAKPWREPAFWGALAVLFLAAAGALFILDVRGSGEGAALAMPWPAAAGVAAVACAGLWTFLRVGGSRASLKAENDLLVRALEAEPGARLIVGPEGAPVYGNAAYHRMFAVDPRSKPRSLDHLFERDGEAGEQISRLREIAVSGEVGRAEIEVVSPSGEPEWRGISASPLEGRPGFVLWSFDDITSRRLDQAIREEREKRLEFLDNASVGFYSVDAKGRFRFINHTLAGWLGYTPEEVVNGEKRLHEFVVGDGLEDAAPYDPFAKRGPGGRGEVTMRKRDGGEVQVTIIETVIEDEGGLHTRSVVLDLTPADEPQQVPRGSEQRFQNLFEDAPIGAALLDLEGKVVECNRAFREMAAAGRTDVVGSSLAGLVAEGERKQLAARLSEVIEGRVLAAPFEVRFPGEKERVASLFLNRMEDGAGRVAGVILQFVDTTGRKNLEMQVNQSHKMQAVGQLAGGIAHDFNNLLTVMIGFCDLLLLRHRPGEQTFADIMQIKQNANRAANLVRQLLAFSRQQTLQPKVLNITDVLAELSNLLRRLIGVNIEFKVIHGRDLGLLMVDQGQFEQVIINLAVNARDAMPGGGTLTIRTSNVTLEQAVERGPEVMPPGDYVLVEVIDTGVGIAKENLERIFEPFFSTKEAGSGTGLGLSTVYGIVKQTGGFVAVDSEVGSGTTFGIYLPRHEPEKEAGEVRPAQEREEARVARDLTGVGTVLLVEDEDAVRLFGARALRNKGYKVYEAKSGEEALEVIKNCDEPIDLVITDVVMPNVDGPTLVRRVRESHPDMKVIFISGYAEDSFREGLSQGADIRFLPKPFSLEQLAGIVKEVIAV